MAMFTSQEKKNLTKLLSCAVNKDEVLSLEGLHGYLFGLAIIPEPVRPSEWLPGIFGEEMFALDDQEEANRLMESFFSAYNRIMQQNRDGKLEFPFNYDTIKNKDIQRIREWAKGLFMATNLRPEIWGMGDDEEFEDYEYEPDDDEGFNDEGIDDEDAEIAGCFAVIMGVAFPERIPELFDQDKKSADALDKDDPELEAKLFALLADAVEVLREYAEAAGEGEETQHADNYPVPPQPLRVEKIGRNDPCPCGSGAKYKKCCGK